MKNIFKLCATAALVITVTSSAFAADSTDLKVQGTLIMGSCTPSLPSDGVVDFGKIPVDSLSATDVNQLGQKEITLTMTCTSPTKMSWSTMDDRTDSVINTHPEIDGRVFSPYGLGFTADNVPIGSYSIRADNNGEVMIDGAPGQASLSDDNNSNWILVSTGGADMAPGGIRSFTFSDSEANPVAFTTASDVLVVGAAIQDTTTLGIADDTPLDGQATISVKYL